MDQISSQVEKMVEMLPEQEQLLAFELIKRMVLAWDSNFTKLTQSEREIIEKVDKEFTNNETVKHEDIWNSKYKNHKPSNEACGSFNKLVTYLSIMTLCIILNDCVQFFI